MIEKAYNFNVNKYQIEYDDKYFAYINVIDAYKIVNQLNIYENKLKVLKRRILS